MKEILFGLILVGCVPTRSNELACDVTADCEDGRTCESGFCVATTVDAGPDNTPDADDGPDGDTFDCMRYTARHFKGCDIPRPTREFSREPSITALSGRGIRLAESCHQLNP